MYKRWTSEGGYELQLIVSKAPRLILEHDGEPVMYWKYEWYESKRAAIQADAMARFGHMELVEQQAWES